MLIACLCLDALVRQLRVGLLQFRLSFGGRFTTERILVVAALLLDDREFRLAFIGQLLSGQLPTVVELVQPVRSLLGVLGTQRDRQVRRDFATLSTEYDRQFVVAAGRVYIVELGNSEALSVKMQF